MIAAIIAAAGSGERFGAAIPKALIQLGDRTLIEHALSSISSVADQIIITAPAGYEKQIQDLVGDGVTVVTGGATRSESVRIGLSKVLCEAEYVLIHDAARALASPALAQSVVAALKAGDVAVIPGLAQTDTVKIVSADGGGSTLHSNNNNVLQTEEIEIRTLDSFNIDNISFIKIDVEDNELQVLMASQITLERSNYPKILFEMNIKNTKLIDFLEQLNYNIIPINGYNNMFLAVNKG